jgi:hypothetical protein
MGHDAIDNYHQRVSLQLYIWTHTAIGGNERQSVRVMQNGLTP